MLMLTTADVSELLLTILDKWSIMLMVQKTDQLSDRLSSSLSASLRALCEKQPDRKIAQIRRAWPEIEAALRAGHTLKRICQCINGTGVEISYKMLSTYVAVIRRETQNVRNSAQRPKINGLSSPINATPSPAAVDQRASGITAPEDKRDPMATARDYLAGGRKIGGFRFKEGVPDLNELV